MPSARRQAVYQPLAVALGKSHLHSDRRAVENDERSLQFSFRVIQGEHPPSAERLLHEAQLERLIDQSGFGHQLGGVILLIVAQGIDELHQGIVGGRECTGLY